MKILIFTDGFRKGGKERRLIEYIKYLYNNKYNFRIVAIHPEIEYSELSEIQTDIYIIKKSSRKSFAPISQFYRICKKYDPDIIHSWSNITTFYSIPTALLLGKKLVNSQISDSSPQFSVLSFYWIITKVNFLFSDCIIANSNAGLSKYNPPVKKSSVVYNGIDITRFDIKEEKDSIKKMIGVNSKYAVVMVATFSENKNYQLYFDVARKMLSEREDVTFIAVGDGRYHNGFKDKIRSWFSPNILLLGKRSDIEKIIKACDIGVLITNKENHGEGISNSIIEYMASGNPVIANDSGGTKEIVTNNYNGYLIQNDRIDEYVDKINTLLDNPDIIAEMGKNARNTVEANFLFDKMSAEYLAHYEQILNRRKK